MARIYLETTVISFYFNARPEPEMVARQNWTRRWLDAAIKSSDELSPYRKRKQVWPHSTR